MTQAGKRFDFVEKWRTSWSGKDIDTYMDCYSKSFHSGGLDKKGVQSNIPLLDKSILANLKGFAPPKSQNDGNDINFAVYPEQDLWKRYSEDKKGLRYPVNAMYKDKHIGTFWIRLEVQ